MNYSDLLEQVRKGIEIYASLPGFENIYEISTFGNIRSLTRVVNSSKGYRTVFGKSVKTRINKQGYLTCSLQKDNTNTSVQPHILVARTFIPNPENKPIVHHKDDNKQNPKLDNLEWTTYVENNTYAAYSVKTDSLTSVLQYSLEGEFIQPFSSASLAAKAVGGSPGNLIGATNGRLKTYKGYIWKKGGNIDEV